MTAIERVRAEADRLAGLQARIAATHPHVPEARFDEWLRDTIAVLARCGSINADRDRLLLSAAASIVLRLAAIDAESESIARGLEGEAA